MSGFRIRDARGADKAAIGSLWKELMDYHRALDPRFMVAADSQEKYVRHALDMIRSRNARVLVAEETDTGTIIAYLMGELQTRPAIALPGLYGFVSDIFVQEAWRHCGVGKALFEELKRWFVLRKAQAIELYVAEANPVASAFWKTMELTPFLTLLHMELE